MGFVKALADILGFGSDPPAVSFGIDVPPEIFGLSTSGGAIAPRISRAEALQVPAVLRARNLIAGTVGSLPLVTIGPDRREVSGTYLLGGNIDPEIPNSVMVAYTLEDLLFEGIAWWRVTRFGWHNYPVEARWVPTSAVHVAPTSALLPSQLLISQDQPFPVDGQVFIDGVPVPDREVVRFDSPNPPLLRHAARAIRTALLLDTTAGLYAEDPQPLTVFTPKEGADVGDREEIQGMLDEWSAARRQRATGYVGAALNLDTVGWSPEQLQLADARQHAVLEIARATGIDPEDLGVSTTSRTYANAETRRRDLTDFTLAAYISALQDRLSMRDVLPRGYQAKVKLDAFLRSDTKTRMETYQIGVGVGAYTTEEIRVLEDRPSLDRQPATPASAPIGGEPAMEQEGGPMAETFTDEQRVELTFDTPAETFQVDPNRRTISGPLVPWGVVAKGWKFQEGSLQWRDPARIKLNISHDRSQLVGRGVTLRPTSQELYGAFKVARGPEGDRALSLAEDGILDGFSIEIDADEWDPDPGDRQVRLVKRATLRGVALTGAPAFDDARVETVVAQDEGNITTPNGGDLDAAARRYCAERGWAMPDTSFPIRPLDNHGRTDLSNAIRAVGRAGGSRNEVRRHIIKRARALGLGEEIPDTWRSDGSLAAQAQEGTSMDKTAEEVDLAQQQDGQVDFADYLKDLGRQVAESQQKLTEGLAASIGDSFSAGIKAALENIHDPQRDGPSPVRAARFQVTREAPIYTFDGRGPTLVRDAWYAQREHDDDARDRLRKFHSQSAEIAKLAAQQVAFHAGNAAAEFTTVTTATASAIIPPGYRPDLFVPQLAQDRPLVNALSRGVIPNATPFVVPIFGSITGAPGAHTEGVTPPEATVAFSTKTVTPGAISGKLPLTREIVDSSNPGIDQIALAAMRENYAQQTEANVYTLLNGANGAGGVITAGLVPSGAQAATVDASTASALVYALRQALAKYPFKRFGAPTMALLGSNATTKLASANDTVGRPLLPSVGALNASGLGNAVTQGWFVDGLAHVPAWAMTGVAAGDTQVFTLNRADAWAWESPVLSFRFEEKSGPQIIELALFGYFATALLRPVGLSGMRITGT